MGVKHQYFLGLISEGAGSPFVCSPSPKFKPQATSLKLKFKLKFKFKLKLKPKLRSQPRLKRYPSQPWLLGLVSGSFRVRFGFVSPHFGALPAPSRHPPGTLMMAYMGYPDGITRQKQRATKGAATPH